MKGLKMIRFGCWVFPSRNSAPLVVQHVGQLRQRTSDALLGLRS